MNPDIPFEIWTGAECILCALLVIKAFWSFCHIHLIRVSAMLKNPRHTLSASV